MPLSSEQRLGLQSLIENHTLYTTSRGHAGFNVPHGWVGTYIMDSIEIIMDSSRHRTRELFIPNSFIRGNDKAQFCPSMASPYYWMDGVARISCYQQGEGYVYEMEQR
jgi:hypothetical protein